MTHDIRAGEGTWTIQPASVLMIGPISEVLAKNPKLRESFPNSSKVYAFFVNLQGLQTSMFFPDDEGAAIMERARLVDAMNKARNMLDANNLVDAMKEAEDAHK